jgi:hypothetical protein
MSPWYQTISSRSMATFFVDTTASVITATSDADSIYVQSAALQGSTILAGGGNDTINLKEVLKNVSAAGPDIQASTGDDSLYIASANYSAGFSVKMGDGADTVQLDGSGGVQTLKLNEGADQVRLTAGGTAEYIGFSKGADTLTFSANFDTIGMGNGHDMISAGSTLTFLTAGLVKLGDGRDTIKADLAGETAATINGGSSDSDLGDLIDLGSTTESLTVRGGAGSDTIEISGVQASAFFAGNSGADSIEVEGTLAANNTIAGGAGNDTIVFSALKTNNAVMVLGGADNDSIFIQSIIEDVENASARFQLGTGSDTITMSGTATSGASLGTYVFSSLAESNLSALDKYDMGDANASGSTDAIFDFSNNASAAGAVGATSAAILFGSDANKATIASNKVILSGTLNVSSVTAVASTVDTLTVSAGAGTTVLFTDKGGTDYLFMQGGTAGTADDAIVTFAGLSAASIAASSAVTVTFSGTDS